MFVGDVVGRPGRRAVARLVPQLRRQHDVHFVIVNAENAAAGYGITQKTAQDILDADVDCITTGNHVWAQKEAYDLLDRDQRILRPANYPPDAPGQGAWVYPVETGGAVGVINLVGRIFMEPADCPFRTAMALIERLTDQCDTIIVDFHAEATSEKIALATYLDGRVAAVLGTHTHVQTADEQILPGGTAFISDVGMTGPAGTIIGVESEIVIRKFLTGLPGRFEVPKSGSALFSGIILETEPSGRRTRAITPVQLLTDGAETLS